ncbi:uncharacterized protein BJ212DRAFT_1571320 [Suillus subaureus]|uniref:Coronin n=1 Tax=Suillus subaureus TaxID=48587 RepID=A0A9P7J3B3_9AGAM|nr:uncharacterized protein BJ212DRAFT_1571320 [Suillus subaureus]KAG1800645.1 hypothetical protein BJ212DRAFT_1571320 [Suillus subaureus]
MHHGRLTFCASIESPTRGIVSLHSSFCPHSPRHVFGLTAKKEHGYDNVKVSSSAWDTNLVSASGVTTFPLHVRGAFAILPLPSPFAAVPNFPYKLPDVIPLALIHTAPVLDTNWSPHNDSIVASGGEDGKVMIWKVESSAFEGWGQDHWVLEDFDPVAHRFHPTASNVLASASSEHTVKLWDLADTDRPYSVLTGRNDTIQCLAFNPTSTLMATTCRDRKLRLFDPRAGGARVIWMGDLDKIVTTGFSKMSDRKVSIWETGGLGNVKIMTIDHDGNIRYYEYESDSLFALAEHKSPDPQRGVCFLPRRALNVSDCEIARAYKVSGSSVEPIAFIVPRKLNADSFQSDIYPAVASSELSLSASEFFAGKTAALKLVSLENGAVFNAPAPAPAPTHVPAPTAFSAPPPVTKAVTMPTPVPQTPVVLRSESAPAPRPTSPISESPAIITPPTQVNDEVRTLGINSIYLSR